MRSIGFAVIACLLAGSLVGVGPSYGQEADTVVTEPAAPQPPPAQQPPPPPARKIPGINAEDPFPKGCIDCHVNMPERRLDTRFSTLLTEWSEKVDPGLLAKAQAAAPAGITLKGKHPSAASALHDIPARCLHCHGSQSKKAPPFERLMHSIHLTGGDESHFMTVFQGQCTFCHKLNLETGAWSIPSGPEP
jgi:hypothetical protein